MKKISKRLLAGALAGVMMTSFGGCTFKDKNDKSLDNESISQTEDIKYSAQFLEDCYLVKYTDIRGNETVLAVYVYISYFKCGIVNLPNYEYLYCSSARGVTNNEEILEKFLESVGKNGSYDSLINYLRADCGIKDFYNGDDIEASIAKTKEILENKDEPVLSKRLK